MRVEAVSHGGDHDACNEHHHPERDGAAIAGQLRPAGGCSQLDFIDQGDVYCRRSSCRALVVIGLLRGRRCSHGVLMSFFWHCPLLTSHRWFLSVALLPLFLAKIFQSVWKKKPCITGSSESKESNLLLNTGHSFAEGKTKTPQMPFVGIEPCVSQFTTTF